MTRPSNDRFANYVSVAERVNAATHEVQLLQSEPPVMLTETLGYIRVTITLVDSRTATGIAQFRLDATTGAQRTNPLEDAETSAVGRALGFLGYSSNRSIATREDIERAQYATEQARRHITVDEAAAKFWEHFGPALGVMHGIGDWSLVQRRVGRHVQPPHTVERWREAWRMVDEALTREVAANAG